MRGYLSATPEEINDFCEKGTQSFPSAYVLTSSFQRRNVDEDHEELEFQLSYMAAQDSRQRLNDHAGFAIALDLEENQLGEESEETISLITEVRWSQVDSVLVSESDDEELTWFASQEVKTQLPQWLKLGIVNGAP